MTRSQWAAFDLVEVALTLAVLAPAALHAACPTVPCDCVGAAGSYRVVTSGELSVGWGFERQLGDRVGSVVDGDLCGQTAELTEPGDDASVADVEGDLHVVAGAGQVAVSARIVRPEPGGSVVVSGVLATGGGSVSGPVSAGTLDTTGTHPGVGSCQQAVADIQAASQMLAALAPTQVLPRIVAGGSGPNEIVAGPGLNVVRVEGGISVVTVLYITLDPATDAVVINGESLSLKRFAQIVVVGGDDTKVVVNLPGPGAGVRMRYKASVAPMVLAPERVIRTSTGSNFAGMFGARALLRGVSVDQTFELCA